MLSELDGFEALSDVVTIGATNRPESLDPALRRPGRFGQHIRVGFPDKAGRKEIFRVQTEKRDVAGDVTQAWLASATDSRYTGADIAAVCEQAAMYAMRDSVETDSDSVPAIRREHFAAAIEDVEPSGETHRRNQRRDITYR